MTSNSLLFLGYSLSDWNLRVILNRIWGARKLVGKSWAVQREPADPNVSKIEQALWDDARERRARLLRARRVRARARGEAALRGAGAGR